MPSDEELANAATAIQHKSVDARAARAQCGGRLESLHAELATIVDSVNRYMTVGLSIKVQSLSDGSIDVVLSPEVHPLTVLEKDGTRNMLIERGARLRFMPTLDGQVCITFRPPSVDAPGEESLVKMDADCDRLLSSAGPREILMEWLEDAAKRHWANPA